MRKAKILLACAAVLTIATMSIHAGWQHLSGVQHTQWTDRPTEASLWQRNGYTGIIVPVKAGDVQVQHDTIVYLAADATTTYGTGLWQIDTNGLYVPRDIDATLYTTRDYKVLSRRGVEWSVDENGYIVPKE